MNNLLRLLKTYYIYPLVLLFIALNSLLVINEFYYFAILPFALVLIYMAFFSLEKLMWFIVFATPLSLNLEDLAIGGVGMYVPTEPLMFGIMLLFILKTMHSAKMDKKLIYHPVSLAIFLNLSWIFITSVTSEMPIVSFKFLLARLWFVICFYFVGIQLFKKISNYKRFFWAYIIPLSGVIVYAFIRLAGYGFEEQPAHWVMYPFYKDHTSYGAILAMYFPVLFIFIRSKNESHIKSFAWLLIGVFSIGLIFSYTRAAWVSLMAALVLYIIYKYRIKFTWLLSLGAVGVVFLVLSWNSLLIDLERNNQDSSDNLTEHVESISNISSDASNLERLNRWSSALRMFQVRPIFGWGPGTYVFQYAPFQLSSERTVISTNAGANGNAHSEYIGPLAESGFMGTLTFVLIIIMVFYRGSLLYHSLPEGELKSIVLSTLLGLLTYVVHGSLNNYLDTDKVSVPFWGFIALIVAIDIYHKKSLETQSK